MRRISANYIYPVSQPPIKNGIVEVDNLGVIQKIIDTKGDLRESRKLEFFNGIIVPGFVNSHCHLELSDLKDKISKKQGLPKFLEEIITSRKFTKHAKANVLELYDSFMKQEGIIAVGDICNTSDTILIKEKSKIYYHTFVEAIGLQEHAEKIFAKSIRLSQEFKNKNLASSIVPHAPYSVSKELLELIRDHAENENTIISIHNQESNAENEMFIGATGGLIDTFRRVRIDLGTFKATGKTSIKSILRHLPTNNNIIFVHNTFTSKEDIDLVNENIKKAFWCLCPKSNLNLEKRLPNIDLFKRLSNVIIGTDSLASNDNLSILDEMKVINKYYPEIKFDKLIKWGTLNGAKALKIYNKYGSIDIGKSPGLNLISNFDFDKMQITEESKIKVLV
ncbi:MAG: amidohydrolase [Marinilabiliales bacterium]|nr:MAG: amidohydrolase [Marinilabiliales bacterium]